MIKIETEFKASVLIDRPVIAKESVDIRIECAQPKRRLRLMSIMVSRFQECFGYDMVLSCHKQNESSLKC